MGSCFFLYLLERPQKNMFTCTTSSPVPWFTDHSQNAQCWLKPRLPQPFWLFLKAHSSSYELALAMKFSAVLAVALTLAVASASNLRQPIYGNNADSASANRVNNNAQFATSADATKPGRAPGYRNAWDDCGGVGASATERMRTSPTRALTNDSVSLPAVRVARSLVRRQTD